MDTAGRLIGRWMDTVRGAGATAGDPDIRAVGEDLLARWDEPHRHYHTATHLSAVLGHLDGAATHAARPDVVRLAAWWHDAVYDPRAAGDANERASAALAGRSLGGLGVPADAAAEVERLVLLTAGHSPNDDDRDGGLLCDADLAVLAGPPASYDRYAAAVRREYAHVPDEAFRAGRAVVLRRLAGLPSIYRLPQLTGAERRAWEERARANLRRELTNLTRS
jgi:predicted metal-dependent HD superfamily phosphohydrolase